MVVVDIQDVEDEAFVSLQTPSASNPLGEDVAVFDGIKPDTEEFRSQSLIDQVSL